MGRSLKVLLVEDSERDGELLLRELRRGGFDPAYRRVDTPAAMRKALEDEDWEVVVSDYKMPQFSGIAALALLKEVAPDLPFVMISGTVGEEVAVEAMKAGADDFMTKGRLARLVPAIDRSLREAELRLEKRRMQEQLILSDRMASVGLLAAGVAHEINNPLAALIANLDFLGNDLARLPEAVRNRSDADGGIAIHDFLALELADAGDSLRDAREAADRVRHIVRDLKVFSRSGDEDRRGPVDVTRILDSTARMAWNEVRHRARLVKDYADVPPVDGNEARLGQVFLNLVVNAAQAIPEGDADRNEVRLSTRVDDDWVTIEVADTGEGIPAEIMNRIFDPFFTTKQQGVGTGLGLAICHRIVSGLGGTLAVESRPGRGTICRVTLRAARNVEEARPESTPADSSQPARRGHVMVIDDESMFAKMIERMLGREHDVEFCTEAGDVVERIRNGERFDVLLCDLMMPSMTGMDVHAALAEIAVEQAERMVFMTGGAFTDRAREFLERVPNPRLEKPFDQQNLRSLVRGIVNGSS